MDPTLTTPVEGQSAQAQPGGKEEWTPPTLKKLDLTETREGFGGAIDLFDESSGPI
jgi:hypothetical protein